MHFFNSKKFFVTLLCSAGISIVCIAEIPQQFRDKGFVYLHEIDPTIQTSVRYYGNENFVGRPIDGYKKPVIVMLRQAAEALKKVQAAVAKDGYSLVVYDAYRPQKAVDHFVAWGENTGDCIKKSYYYPRINKKDVFALDYVAVRSGHSRGSTVDLTIIKKGAHLKPVVTSKRMLLDGSMTTFLDDGTVDMGSSFDLFDEASHTKNKLVSGEHQNRRMYLKNVMEKYGFKNFSSEWWHFTLKDEPYPADLDSSYFNFDIE